MGTLLRGRAVDNNQTVLDQADFFLADGFTRAVGLGLPQITSQLFFQNVVQPWPLVSGVGVTDAQVVSGKVYWNEVPGSPGIYNVRWRPNAIGYWRLILTYTAGQQILAQDYDVQTSAPASGGLKASFMKPNC